MLMSPKLELGLWCDLLCGLQNDINCTQQFDFFTTAIEAQTANGNTAFVYATDYENLAK